MKCSVPIPSLGLLDWTCRIICNKDNVHLCLRLLGWLTTSPAYWCAFSKFILNVLVFEFWYTGEYFLCTVNPVCNDHFYNYIHYQRFIQQCVLMKTEGINLLLLTISAFWSSSRWPLATQMSPRRKRSIPLGGRYRQVSLYIYIYCVWIEWTSAEAPMVWQLRHVSNQYCLIKTRVLWRHWIEAIRVFVLNNLYSFHQPMIDD